MHSKLYRTSASFLVFSFMLTGMQQAVATQLNISQTPLLLSESVPPNVILTMDDSGSMVLSVVPDGLGNNEGERRSRRIKSSYVNPMYYNPAVTYQAPVIVNANGGATGSYYDTSFEKAYINGYVTGRGNIDLRSNYLASMSYNPSQGRGTGFGYSTGNSALAENPYVDFRPQVTLQNNSSTTLTIAPGVTINISRGNGNTCSATISGISTNGSMSCTRVSGNDFRADLSQVGIQAYYYNYNANLAGCSKTKTDDNCYELKFVSETSGQLRADDSSAGTDERKNFAIWYSFYRSRALASMTAANIAFNNMPSSIRLTWQALNGCSTLNSNSSCYGSANLFRQFSGSQRGQFFAWLPQIEYGGSTPLKAALQRVGSFLTASNTPVWDKMPGSETTPKYSCRPSYHIMMTDGMWNEGTQIPTAARNADNATIKLPDGKQYNGTTAPFTDPTSNTLADLAFYYWATDLNTNLDNKLKPFPNKETAEGDYWNPKYNPATWQHLINFNIGLGLGEALNKTNIPWGGETYAGAGYLALKNGTVAWPEAKNSNSEENVYDLWHAAVNSRGEFFSADDPNAMVKAFQQIVNRIGDGNSSASRPAVSGSQTAGDREVYETGFSSEDWSGKLQRYNVTSSGRSLAWSAETQLTGARTVKMAASNGTSLQNFEWANLTATQQAYFKRNPDSSTLAPDSKGQDRVNYIRGSRANEGSASGNFRQRSTVLGDIINSAPAYVKNAQYLAYLAGAIDGGTAKYKTFQDTAASRTPMVYVGANDGMLHGFNATSGAETFAFVPTAVIPELFRLTGQTYKSGGHQFYVDGSPVVSDVYFNDKWHTVLIGTLNGGGRSLFALDVTDPGNIKLLWEFTHADLGNTFPQPVMARLHNGKWAVVTGNGYGNQAGAVADKAALFVLDVETGKQLTTGEAPIVVTGDATKANGLSSVRLADNNSDGIADYAYAGDIQGNLWRFDLFGTAGSGTDPFSNPTAGIKASYGGAPLFKAVDGTLGKAQTIMAPPSLVRHPSQVGYLVIFGTGKYFEEGDGSVDNTRAQSIYAIWDRKTRGETTSTPPSVTRSKLLTQTIQSQASTAFKNANGSDSSAADIRLISTNTPTWYKSSATGTTDSDVQQWGWLLDLQVGSVKAGEMMISPMSARGETLLLSTITPNEDPCADGTETWLYGINPSTGGRNNFTTFDMSGDGSVDGGDNYNGNVVSGRKMSSSSGFTLSGDIVFSSGESLKVNYGPTSNGRQTWQVIPDEEE